MKYLVFSRDLHVLLTPSTCQMPGLLLKHKGGTGQIITAVKMAAWLNVGHFTPG